MVEVVCSRHGQERTEDLVGHDLARGVVGHRDRRTDVPTLGRHVVAFDDHGCLGVRDLAVTMHAFLRLVLDEWSAFRPELRGVTHRDDHRRAREPVDKAFEDRSDRDDA